MVTLVVGSFWLISERPSSKKANFGLQSHRYLPLTVVSRATLRAFWLLASAAS